MPYKPVKAFAFAVLLWITGFIWGCITFMIPALHNAPPIKYISLNIAISLPIIIGWIFLSWALAKGYLKSADNKPAEGLKFGIVLMVTNFVLDLAVLIILLDAPWEYFRTASVWLAYGLLVIIPWLVGRLMAKHS